MVHFVVHENLILMLFEVVRQKDEEELRATKRELPARSLLAIVFWVICRPCRSLTCSLSDTAV